MNDRLCTRCLSNRCYQDRDLCLGCAWSGACRKLLSELMTALTLIFFAFVMVLEDAPLPMLAVFAGISVLLVGGLLLLERSGGRG